MPSELTSLLTEIKAKVSPFRRYLDGLHKRFRDLSDGAVADYIPELAGADPASFGISVTAVDGQRFQVGDCKIPFSLQSCSKVFSYGLALEDLGEEATLSRVGVEPTGEAFNSIILDEASGRPYNPMVNAGAIATTGLIAGDDHVARLKRLLASLARYAGRELSVDAAVYASERKTGHRNRAIAHLMLNFGMLEDAVDDVLDLYFSQCSVLVDAGDLSVMAATLANGGVNPVTGERALETRYVKNVLSVMYTSGMYDFAGEWLYRVGLPAKSGVTGSILVVVPGRFGLAIYSPPLDERGNSVRGIAVSTAMAQDLGLHVFDVLGSGRSLPDLLEGAKASAPQAS